MVCSQNIDERRILNRVNLVQNQQHVVGRDANLIKNLIDRVDLPFGFGVTCIDNMQQQVGAPCFFQCRTERCDQVVRQIANKSNGVA